MRIRGAKTELEDAGLETEGMVESTAKLRQEILALSGVDIMEADGSTFKSTYAILDELSQKWKDLTDIQQASITELIAGKRQGNIISSLMTNFDTARDALETSLNSAGSAMAEHEKWQQSLEAQINKLKASWQGLSQAFLSSDFLKVALDGVIALVDGLTKLVDTIGTIPTLLSAFASFKVLKTVFSTLSNGGGLNSLGGILGLLQKSFPNITKGVKKLVTSLREVSIASGGAGNAFGGFIKLVLQHPYIAIAAAAVAALTAVFVIQKKKAEELAKEVDELTDSYKTNHDELKKLQNDYDTSNESSMVSRYAKLSKGVDGLGRNVSLTADEYSEYQSIVNQIAEQIPSLVSGYDSQGNALLSCKGNVEELTAAYEKLIHAQNQEILTNTGNIEKDFTNTLNKADGNDWWSDGHGFWAGVIQSKADRALFAPLLDYELKNDTAQGLKNLLSATSGQEKDKILKQLKSDRYSSEEIRDALDGAGIDVGYFEDPIKVLEKTLETDPQKIKNIVDNYYSTFADAVEEQKTIATAKLSEAFDISSAISGLDYSNISEELQTIAYQVVNSLDLDFFTKLQEQGKTVEQWTTELLNQLNTIGKVNGDIIADAFELQTQFNGGDIDVGDYINKLKEVESIIDGLDLKDEAKQQLKISLGLDENGVVDQYDALIKRLTTGAENSLGLDATAVKKFVDDLSTEEYSALIKILPDLDTGTTIDEIQSLIDDQLATEFTFDIKVQTEGIEALNTALAESRSAAGLTSESIEALKARYEDLDGFNAAALFEKTANGIRLNSDELSRLEEQYINTNKLEIDKNLNTLVEKYQDVNNELKTNTSLTEDERKELEASKEALADKIDEVSTLASQYEGLTSAFAKWQDALNGAEEGDNYDSVVENLEAMKELDDKKLYGTDKYKTFAQFMSYEDLSSASIDEIGEAFDKGYKKAERYFTETKQGSTNFLKDLNKINSEWAYINENGDWEVNIDVEEAAKELGISVSAVLSLLDKLKDYGIEVNIEDNSVDNLHTKIQQTEAKLKELGQSPVDINVDIEASSENLSKIESEIEKAKTKITEINNSSVSPEVKTAQLEDARAKLEALIQKKQEASQPAFMKLNTSQVNASLVDALEKIKSYQIALNELNELKELKAAGIAIDDSEIAAAEEKLDGFAKAIQGLDGDVKVAIGLEEDGSIDSIHKAFEEGKVKIDANTDPALTKIEQLAENVERIEDKDVTINVTVNGLDQVKELNKQIDLATDIDGNIDKLSKYVENAKALSELEGNIVSSVSANVRGNVTETAEYKLNNLKVFGESAKEVKDVGSFTSNVTANVKGNVIETPEYQINNLKVFSDSASDLEDIGSPTSTVTAEVKGNVTETAEFKLNNLKVFTDSAKDIESIGNVDSKVTAEVEGDVTETAEYKLNNLKVFTDNARDIESVGNVESVVTAEVKGDVTETAEFKLNNLKVFTDNARDIKNIDSKEVTITANVEGDVTETAEYKLDNLKVFADSAKDVESIGSPTSTVTANIEGNVFEKFETTIDNLKVFVDGAKGFRNEDLSSTVTANVEGNVIDTPEYKINNLEVFADGAKKIKGIGNVDSRVNADIEGNVIDKFEYKIDNLKAYSDNAKDVEKIGNVTSKVTADVDGNVIDTFEYKINNLKAYTNDAKDVKNVGVVKSSVTADVDGNVIDTFEYQIDNLKTYSDSAKDVKNVGVVKSSVTADVNGNVTSVFMTEGQIDNLKVFSDSAKNIKDIGEHTTNVTANINGNVINTSEDKIDNLGVFAINANKLKGTGNFTSSVAANVSGNVITDDNVNSDLEHFASIVSGMSSQTVTVSVNANVDSTNINNAIDLLTKVANSGVFKDYNATVQVGAKIAKIDDTTVKNYQAPPKEGKVSYSVDPNSSVYTWTAPDKDGVVNYSASVEALTDAQKHKTGTITYKANIIGFGGVVNGTANANGSAFANGTSGKAFKQGDWGVKKTTTALTGELGQELVVYKNRWYTVGDNGAEFATIPKGAIVFNHKQTEELFRNGKVTSDGGRGKALANGTAFASGAAFASGTDSFKESFDWIEVAISRLERAINNLEQTIDDSYRSWDSRESALGKKISKLGEEITKQERAKDEYNNKATSAYADLSSYMNNKYPDTANDYLRKITTGVISVQDIDDEELAEKIKAYQEWYEKALEAEDAIIELTAEKMDSFAQYFENTVSKYDSILEGFEHTESMIDEYINQAEAKGHIVSGNYYQALIDNNKNNIIPTLTSKRQDMIADRQTYVDEAVKQLMSEGMSYDEAFAEVLDSEKFKEMSTEINGVTQEIEAAKTQTIEWANEIRNIDWEVFDLIQERISDVIDEADFLIELMSNDKLFDDNGGLTDKGMATMGLHAQNYNTYMYQADEYKKEIDELDAQIAKNPYDQELINRRNELLELQRESILAAEDEKEAMRDLVEEGINLELDALQEKIDLYQESLDSQKD